MAVSSGYLTTVFVAVSAPPAIKPLTVSSHALLLLPLFVVVVVVRNDDSASILVESLVFFTVEVANRAMDADATMAVINDLLDKSLLLSIDDGSDLVAIIRRSLGDDDDEV